MRRASCGCSQHPKAMYLKRAAVIFALLGAVAFTSSAAKRSPFHFEYKNKIYYIETFFKATFFKAFMSCSKLGMNLLSIDSVDEYDKIHEFIKSKAKYERGLMIWTSGAAMESKQFHWMYTGYPVDLPSKWLPGEPNNLHGGTESCLQLWVHSLGNLVMNDERCLTQSYFICEQERP